jgi:hypothetical protein
MDVSNVLYREKETAFLRSREAVKSEDRVWEFVGHLIESISKDLSSSSSKRTTTNSDTVESNNNTNLNTSDQKSRVVKKDTTRMRELLLQLPPSTSTATLSC